MPFLRVPALQLLGDSVPFLIDSGVAIDDDAEGWDSSDRARLVQTDAETGLSDPAVVARLSDLLAGK